MTPPLLLTSSLSSSEFTTSPKMLPPTYEPSTKERINQSISSIIDSSPMCLSEIQEDAALIQFYLQAIRKEIRDLLHLISSFSATLADLVEHAAQIDQNMKNSRFFDRPNWPPPRTTIWANLTNEQCQDYFKQGKCFNCGLRGHLAWACPTRKKGKAQLRLSRLPNWTMKKITKELQD